MATDKTADFLVEVGTEELPPKALRKLKDSFATGIAEGLQHIRGLFYLSGRRTELVIQPVRNNHNELLSRAGILRKLPDGFQERRVQW